MIAAIRTNRLAAGVVALALLTSCSFFACGTPGLAAPQDRAPELSIPDVAERVSPAVVSIYASRLIRVASPFGSWFEAPFGGGANAEQQSLGSGAIVAADGVILTNNHVVDHAQGVRVVLPDRREFPARIVGRDPETDLAVLRIEAKNLPVLPFGDSAKIRVGETVLAVGNPLGVGETVSKGIISAKGRAHVGITEYEDFLQTDAAINPGNSGGALVNLRGELVGVNTAIASRTGGFQGIGFAIPSNMAHEVLDILLREGKVSRGQMGAMIQDLTPALAASLDGAPKEGVLVGDVAEGSPAEKAGLRRGDVVLKLDGQSICSSSDLRNRVALRGAGKDVRLTLWRGGATKELTIHLRAESEERREAEAAEEEEPGPEAEAARGSVSGLAGVRVVAATSATLRRAGLSARHRGLFVTSVDPSASFAGLREGDLILEVNRKPVGTVEELCRQAQSGPDQALLAVRRGAEMLFVAIPKDSSSPPASQWRRGESY